MKRVPAYMHGPPKTRQAMKTICRTRQLIATFAMVALLGACGTPDVYKQEAFSKESPYQKNFRHGATQACAAAQLALLSQGYRIENAEEQSIRAKKDFQPDDNVNVTIDFDVTCKDADNGSMVFANAVQTSYQLKKTSGATSLSVPGAGSIAMPWGKNTDSLVKVAGETIADERFYKRFFDLLAGYLGK